MTAAQEELVRRLEELSLKLGEVGGSLATSEKVGIVEDWRARAEKAEAELAASREALEEVIELASSPPYTAYLMSEIRQTARNALATDQPAPSARKEKP